MKCPRCQRRLAAVAENCLCGWSRVSDVEKRVSRCAWEGCSTAALICEEIEPGKGRHNLCEQHWLEAHRRRAERWCAHHGLETLEQKKEFCRKLAKGVFQPMPTREPGEDDDLPVEKIIDKKLESCGA